MEGAAVFRLLLALAMAPLVWGVGKRLRLRRAVPAFAAAYGLTVAAYAADVMDDVFTGGFFDSMHHVAYALVALSVVVGAVLARADVADAVGPQ